MNRVWLGALLGVTVGVADVLLMLPMQFQDLDGRTSSAPSALASPSGSSPQPRDCRCRPFGLASWSDS